MRKVEQNMLRLLNLGKNGTASSNTVVRNGSVYLFGNEIIRNYTGHSCEWRWAGWRTVTTASRLRAVLSTPLNDMRERRLPDRKADPYAWHYADL